MQDPRMTMNPRKHHKSQQRTSLQESSPPLSSLHKPSKKATKSDVPQQLLSNRSMSSAQVEPTIANEYRALRRKYLLLEEESGNLGSELREAEDEIRELEDEKLQLLDQLVVLEGLVDPSELHNPNL